MEGQVEMVHLSVARGVLPFVVRVQNVDGILLPFLSLSVGAHQVNRLFDVNVLSFWQLFNEGSCVVAGESLAKGGGWVSH